MARKPPAEHFPNLAEWGEGIRAANKALVGFLDTGILQDRCSLRHKVGAAFADMAITAKNTRSLKTFDAGLMIMEAAMDAREGHASDFNRIETQALHAMAHAFYASVQAHQKSKKPSKEHVTSVKLHDAALAAAELALGAFCGTLTEARLEADPYTARYLHPDTPSAVGEQFGLDFFITKQLPGDIGGALNAASYQAKLGRWKLFANEWRRVAGAVEEARDSGRIPTVSDEAFLIGATAYFDHLHLDPKEFFKQNVAQR